MTLLQSSPQAPDQSERPASTRSRATGWHALCLAALCPLVAGYAVLVALLALVSALASNSSFSATSVLLAAGPGWLAAWHVPIEIDARPLGVLPLLLTGMVLLLAERAAAGAADRLGPGRPVDAIPLIATVAGAHAVFGGLIALLCGSGPVTAAPAAAFFTPGVLATLAAAFGVRGRYGLLAAVTDRMDAAVRLGLRTGRIALLVLFAVGALVFLVAVVASFGTARRLFADTAAGAGDGFGLLLLSLGYLPNVLIGTTSFIAGPGFAIGSVQASPFGLIGGPLPGLPVLGALPEQPADWWPLLLLLPVLVGVFVGWCCREVSDVPTKVRAVGVAALLVGSGCLVLAALAGGALGGGVFGPVEVPAGLLAVATFCWIALPGAATALLAVPRPVRGEGPGHEIQKSGYDGPVEEDTGGENASKASEAFDEGLVGLGFPADDLGPPKGRIAAERARSNGRAPHRLGY